MSLLQTTVDLTSVSIYELAMGGMALVITLGSFLGAVNRWVLRPIVNSIKELIREELRTSQNELRTDMDSKLTPIEEKLEDIEADVADIRHEVNTNNGKSLKDVVLSMRTEVAVLAGRFEDHLNQSEG